MRAKNANFRYRIPSVFYHLQSVKSQRVSFWNLFICSFSTSDRFDSISEESVRHVEQRDTGKFKVFI